MRTALSFLQQKQEEGAKLFEASLEKGERLFF
jgi:hypothetical protein